VPQEALTAADKTWIAQQIAAVTAQDKPQADGTPNSKLGRAVLSQGIPNGTREGMPRDYAWKVLEDLGAALTRIEAKVDELAKQV